MSETPAATRTVERALVLLVAVADHGGTLTELAREAALSASTASRLLATLAQHGFVRRDPSGRYAGGAKLRQLAAATLGDDPLYELSAPHLEALAAITGETAHLAVAADADRVLYLRGVASPQLVGTAVWTGRTIPRVGTALGAVLDGRLGPGGYLALAGTVEPEVTSIAAPIHGPGGEIVAAISLLAPTYRTPQGRVASYGQAVAHHARELSRSLGNGDAGEDEQQERAA